VVKPSLLLPLLLLLLVLLDTLHRRVDLTVAHLVHLAFDEAQLLFLPLLLLLLCCCCCHSLHQMVDLTVAHLVHLASGEVVISCECDVQEALIVAQV
jgi:hypothetical protein